MLLAIDIGNSSINMGFFDNSNLNERLRLRTRPLRPVAEYLAEIDAFLLMKNIEKPLLGVIISSVVPELTDILTSAVSGLSAREPLLVTIALDSGLVFDIEKPEEIGADRVANAVAASKIFGSPVVVVDFGTATTLSAVRDGRFIGGAILPGLGMMRDSLSQKTSRLPAVELDPKQTAGTPEIRALGKNTIQCIISGIIYGTAWAVEGIISEIEKAEGCILRMVATGGYSGMMAGFIRRRCSIDPDLTLKGLRMLYERNS